MMTKTLIMLASATALLAGCTLHRSPPATTAITVAPAPFAAVEGKSFYLFERGFTCGGPVPGAPQVPSWADRIEVVEGRLVRWGSRCGGEGLPVAEAEQRAARLSADGVTLTLGGHMFRQSADPVKQAEAQ